MSEIILGFAVGLALGGLHLLALRWQTARLRRPAGVAAGSALRLAALGAAVTGIAVIADSPGAALVSALAGMMLARLLLVRLLQPRGP